MPGRSFEPVSGSGSQKLGYEKPASRRAASPITKASAALTATTAAFLIQLELMFIVLFQRRVLRFLAEKTIADRERLDLGAHEAAESVLRAADNRLAAHVEAGVDDDRAARLLLELADQVVEARVGFLVHRLHARRIVDVRHRWDRGARHVQLLDAEELLLFLAHRDAVLVANVGDEQHVRALAIDVEVLRRILCQHRGSERAE